MAKMIPPIYVGHESRGEEYLFGRLRDDAATQGWVVFHSLNIRKHMKKKEGEADFVVLIPDMGILCIEVKAAKSIHRSGGNWYFGDDPKPDPAGPFSQVASARESIHRYLKNKEPILGRIPCFSLVVFTHCNFLDTDIGFVRDDYLNKRDIYSASISKLLTSVMQKRLDEFDRKYSWFDRNACHLTGICIEQVVKALRGDFEVYISPRDRANEVYEELKRFTDQQFRVFDAIYVNPRVLVQGAAGTGKTFVAIEACRRAVDAGKRVLFLCFNNALGHKLKDELECLGDNIHAGTLHSYMLEVSKVELDVSSPSFWDITLPEAAFDAVEEPLFDYLVIDEAQDILNENDLLFLSACLHGTLSDGRWLMLGDFCGQNIYSEEGSGIDLLTNYGYYTSALLKDNCRNTPRIVETYKQISSLETNIYQSVLRADNGEDPHWHNYDSERGQVDLLKSLLKKLRKKYLDSEIVILSPHKDCCAKKISGTYWSGILSSDVDDASKLRYTTIHAFKGLEAQAIILTDFSDFEGIRAEKLFYIAASRATAELTVLYDKDAVSQLMNILNKDAKNGI